MPTQEIVVMIYLRIFESTHHPTNKLIVGLSPMRLSRMNLMNAVDLC
jgi:hypothetical protein